MKQLLFLAASALAIAPAAGAANWSADKSHSKIGFTATHLVISEVDGSFGDYTVTVASEKEDFTDATIDVVIKTSSITTGAPKRDEHLRSNDFFDSAKHPDMVFKGTTLRKTGERTYKLDGTMTIRDVTKPLTLDVTYTGSAKDPWGNTKVGFKLSGTLNRSDFGLTWNKALEAGGVLVGEEIVLDCSVQLARAAK
jgi:polyisoprenoid-binding protein YceI